MKPWTKTLAVAVMVCFVAHVNAADESQKPAGKAEKTAKADKVAKPKREPANPDKDARKAALRGEVVKVEGNNLTLKVGRKKQQKEVTVTADASTVVKIEGKNATLADLKPGQRVNVIPDTGTPTRIAVPAAKAKAEKAEKNPDKAPKKADQQ